MIRALFGPSTVPATLRDGLDRSMEVHKTVAGRIAGAVTSSTQNAPGEGGAAGESAANDLVADMATLADTQLRYEAEAKLLQVVYQSLRNSVKSSG